MPRVLFVGANEMRVRGTAKESSTPTKVFIIASLLSELSFPLYTRSIYNYIFHVRGIDPI